MEENNLKFTKIRFIILLVLILIGIGLCLDLTYIFIKTNFHDVYVPSFCTVSDLIDCDGVAKTTYSLSFGVPNAIWGLLVYSILFFLLFVDRIQAKFKNTIFDVFENPRSYIATISLLTFCLSMILAFISIFKIHKICVLCFATYFVDLFIALSARTKGFFFEDIKTTVVDFLKGAKKYFALFLVVLAVFIWTLKYLSDSLILSPKLKKERQQKEFFDAKTNKYAIKGNILGKKNSKVIVKIYSDYNCPYCRVGNIMMHKLAHEEDVLIEEVNFPLDNSCNWTVGRTLLGHDNSCLLAKYALAAKRQGKFWGAGSTFFDKHPMMEEDIINALKDAPVGNLGLDYDKLKQDANSSEIEQELRADIIKASELGITGTPQVEINGVQYQGILPYDELVEKVRLAKKRAENNK